MEIQAAVFRKVHEPLTIETVDIDRPWGREVLVRTVATGVCHSDLHVVDGVGRFPLDRPIVLGHEGAGVVEAVGTDVTTVKPGDHVVACLSGFCGNCPQCLSGHPNLCTGGIVTRPDTAAPRLSQDRQPLRQFIGISSYAEKMLLHENSLVKIDPELPLDKAALVGCGVLTGVGAALRSSGLEAGQTVAVFGCGGVGLSIVQGARIGGARQIIAIDQFGQKRQMAMRVGATHFVNSSETDPVKAVREFTGGAGVDHAFEAVGLSTLVRQAIESLAIRGTATIVGVLPPDAMIEFPWMAIRPECKVQTSRMGSNRFRYDIPTYLEFFRQGRLDLDAMVTKQGRLSDINEAFRAMKAGEVARTVLTFDQGAYMHSIRIDRGKRLAEEPGHGHNRFHPDIAPIVEVGEGQEVALETRDALDGQLKPGTTVADFPSLDVGAVHPLTGPVFVKGAAPGDLLEIEFTDIIAQTVAFSAIMPGLGFLRDVMTEPFLAHWQIHDGWATSQQIPGVRIPGAPFMGVSGVAPSAEKLTEWTAREQRVIDRGGLAFPPDLAGAVPTGACGLTGLRTLPPRENGGNFDVKQLTKGSKLFLPVFKEGGLFSTGDGHFAQGDGEVCVTAVEMGATAVVRFKVHKGLANRRKFTAPVFSRTSYFIDPRYAAPERFLGVMGMPINAEDEIEAENLTLACRNAVLNMMELLQERGFSREQAYVICSVAVDLRISNVVDVPNYVVSALLPEAIFGGD